MYQKSLDIRISVFGTENHVSDHPSVADSKYRIAEIHEKQGNLKEAKAIFLECEKIYSKVFGDEHERTLDTRTRAATVGQQAE